MATVRHIRREPMTVDEYLAFEEQSDIRHEYVDGEVYAFAGASRRQGKIVSNINHFLWDPADQLGCEVQQGDLKLRAAPNILYYPDVMVICDTEEQGRLIVSRPCFIVEVLSPSTEMIDLREKSVVYRNIPSLQSFALVYQDRHEVIHNYREESGKWTRQFLTDGSFEVPCLNTELSFDQIYRRLPE